MARSRPPGEQLEDHISSIRFSFKHWKKTKKHGAKDPSWPDGTNLNLIRNHIIYDQMRARELCEALNVKCPAEASLKLPRELSNEYSVKKAKKRGRRV